jgi:hypothetical protein
MEPLINMKPLDDPNQAEQRRMLLNIIWGISIWGGLLALGAFSFRQEYDFRKPLIVLFFVGAFLAFWIYLLRRRFQRPL